MGYFSPNRWASVDGKNCHEIAINPLYVGRATLIELMQTLVHEMTHCWQHCYGTPSRRSYHNKEWASKMIEVGLMPSSTGQPGGRIVGQKISDYPAPKGKFINECAKLLSEKDFTLPWVDRLSEHHGQTDNEQPLTNELTGALAGMDEGIASQLTASFNTLFGDEAFISPQETNTQAKVKAKYICPGCHINVWGKHGLSLRCDDCDLPMQETT